MQHQEMIQPTQLGVISRTCLFSFLVVVAVIAVI